MKNIIVVSALAVATFICAQPSFSQTINANFQYAVKFACGQHPGGTYHSALPVVSGEYLTSINIHNPSEKGVFFGWKVATAYAEGQPGMSSGAVSPFYLGDLKGDQAMTLRCIMLSEKWSGDGYAEGFVVIDSEVELDVISVYTARPPKGDVSTLDVEEVRPKRRAKRITVAPVSPG